MVKYVYGPTQVRNKHHTTKEGLTQCVLVTDSDKVNWIPVTGWFAVPLDMKADTQQNIVFFLQQKRWDKLRGLGN